MADHGRARERGQPGVGGLGFRPVGSVRPEPAVAGVEGLPRVSDVQGVCLVSGVSRVEELSCVAGVRGLC